MEVADIIFWFIFIVAIITALWYIIGHSPTFEQSLLLILIGVVLRNERRLAKVESKLEARG